MTGIESLIQGCQLLGFRRACYGQPLIASVLHFHQKMQGQLQKNQPDFFSHPETMDPSSLSLQGSTAQSNSLALS